MTPAWSAAESMAPLKAFGNPRMNQQQSSLVKSLTSAYKNGDRLKQPQVSWIETSFNPIEKY